MVFLCVTLVALLFTLGFAFGKQSADNNYLDSTLDDYQGVFNEYTTAPPLTTPPGTWA